MLISQDGRCLICGGKFGTEVHTCAHIDHSHDSGLVRGLLCHACNKIIGFARDNIVILNNAINYLNKYNDI